MSNSMVRILIVEDNPLDQDTYNRFLSGEEGNHTYLLCNAETLEDGIKQIEHFRPHCILLDYMLPDANGLDFLTRLAALDLREDAPVVVMLTGQGDERVAVEAMKAGAKDYLAKDKLNADGLVRSIRYAMESREKERALKLAEQLRVLVETAGAAAHEINQPLQTVVGLVDLLLLDTKDGQARENLILIRQAGKRIQEIIKKMGQIRQYETKNYVGNTKIVDFDAAAEG